MKSMIDAINKRVSVRSYIDSPIEQGDKDKINDLLLSAEPGPFGNKIRFGLLDLSELEKKEIKGLGTYGLIKDAKLYIVSAVKDKPRVMLDLGYVFEKLILEATSMGFGTCWMGGTFQRANFAKRMNLAEDEILPAISPIGYGRKKRTIQETALRNMVNADNRKPWDDLFFDGDFHKALSKEMAGIYALPLESIRRGPSASNNQPWRIVYDNAQRAFHFYLKRTPGYSVFSRGIDMQLIDIGIAMCQFELTAVEKGLNGKWQVTKPAIATGDAEYIVTWQEP